MWMSPTYTPDAAGTIMQIIARDLPYGIYHLTNNGSCTWFQFTQEILRLTGFSSELKGIKTAQMQVKAKRPLNSSLTSTKLPMYNLEMRSWKEALHDYLVEKGHITKK
jgi:dTDP-4-dehydrorhamnose reductase